MQNENVTRRQLLTTVAIGTAAVATPPRGYARGGSGSAGLPAILGGKPVRTVPFPHWPNFREADEKAVLPVLRSGVWSRAKVVDEAERRFARLMGAKYCVTTSNGTNALITAVRALGIGAEDEVITTPYTFVATIHPILLANALPVFVDIDAETWQIDPAKIEAKITTNTVAILPVHIIGGVCDMDRIKRDRKEAQPQGHRGRLRSTRRGVEEQEGRDTRRPGLLQFSERQVPDLRRGGCHPRTRREVDGPLLLVPQPGPPARQCCPKKP
jgi:hypothetical protein